MFEANETTFKANGTIFEMMITFFMLLFLEGVTLALYETGLLNLG